MIPHLTREKPYLSLRQAVDLLPIADKFEVARFLASRGIKGNRHRCRTCPIAVFLTRATGAIVDVTACAFHPFSTECVELPDSVIGFIDEFDDGSLFCALEAS